MTRIAFRDADSGELLFDMDDIPVPRPGDLVTFPSGHKYRVVDRPAEYLIRESPTHLHVVTVHVELHDG